MACKFPEFNMHIGCEKCPVKDCAAQKSLAQYLDEYIEHEAELNNISSEVAELFAYNSWRELLEQALDAYESTEGVVIQIIKKKEK